MRVYKRVMLMLLLVVLAMSSNVVAIAFEGEEPQANQCSMWDPWVYDGSFCARSIACIGSVGTLYDTYIRSRICCTPTGTCFTDYDTKEERAGGICNCSR